VQRIAVTLPDGTQIGYLIDGQNRRVGKTVNGVTVERFVYQDELRPIAQLDGNNNVVSRFVYSSGKNIPDFMINGGVTYRILTDQVGSPRLVVNTSNGAVAQRLDYDEFGNVLTDTNPGFQPFGFAGGLYDQQSKLSRFGARDYDAETGRMASKDPVGFNGGSSNLFAYAAGDPVNVTDASGYCPKQSCWSTLLQQKNQGLFVLGVGGIVVGLLGDVFWGLGTAMGVGGLFLGGLPKSGGELINAGLGVTGVGLAFRYAPRLLVPFAVEAPVAGPVVGTIIGALSLIPPECWDEVAEKLGSLPPGVTIAFAP